ncbi:MAG: EAL domain-containing protein [Thermoanaerobaculia bacterium]
MTEPPQHHDRECVLIVDDDADVAEAVALGLEHAGRSVVICADVEAAEMCMERFPVTHVVSDVQFSGPFGFEGFHFLGRVHERRPDCRVALMTGRASEELRSSSMRAGAAALLAKPFGIEELELALGMSRPLATSPAELHRVPSLTELLRGSALSTVYQPIVALSDDRPVIAYESLARVRNGWPLGDAGTLFEYAVRRAQTEALNLACLQEGIAASSRLPEAPILFLNVDPPLLESPRLHPVVRQSAERAGLPLSRVVLEITERSGVPHNNSVNYTLDALRADGIRFALDDVGTAHSHLEYLDQIQPSFMKISQTFGTRFESSSSRERIVRHVIALAHDFGCAVILEGVEDESTAVAARHLGIEFAQGYHFGRPSEASSWLSSARAVPTSTIEL